MGRCVMNQNIEIEKLKDEIRRADAELDKDTVNHVLEQEKARKAAILEQVKDLKNKHLLKKNEIPKDAVRIQQKNHIEERKTVPTSVYNNPAKNRQYSPVTLLILALSVGVAILLLTSWIRIGSYEINWMQIFDGLDFLEEMTGDSFGVIKFGIVVLQLSLVINAIIYARLAYKKFIGEDDDTEYKGLIYMIVIFIIYLLASVFFSYLLEDWFGGSFIKSRLTFSAWLALALSIGIAVIHYKEDELEDSFHPYAAVQQQEHYEGTEENQVAIVSQYPWENVSPLSLTLHKGANTFMKLEYEYQGVFVENSVFPEKKGDKVMMIGDVLLKAGWYEYAIEDVHFLIPYLNHKGNTDKVYLNNIPFQLGNLSNGEVLIKSVKILHENNALEERSYSCHI